MQTHTHTKYIDLNKLYLEFFLYGISIKFYCINTTNYINYKKKPTKHVQLILPEIYKPIEIQFELWLISVCHLYFIVIHERG